MIYVITERRHVDYEEDEFTVHRESYGSEGDARRAMLLALGGATRDAINNDMVDDVHEVSFDISHTEASVDGQGWWTHCEVWPVSHPKAHRFKSRRG